MKAIKGLVLFLGILILAGLGLLGYGLFAKKAHKSGMAQPAAAAQAGDVGEIAVPVPAGSRIEQMSATADRVILRMTAPQGPERLLILDPASGRVTGGITLTPEPAIR